MGRLTRLIVHSCSATVEVTLVDGRGAFFWWARTPCPRLSRTIDMALADGGDFAEALVRHDRTLRIERVGEREAIAC